MIETAKLFVKCYKDKPNLVTILSAEAFGKNKSMIRVVGCFEGRHFWGVDAKEQARAFFAERACVEESAVELECIMA